MDKLLQAFTFVQEAPAAPARSKPDTFDYYIEGIQEQMSNYNSPTFFAAVNNFASFVSAQYKKERERNEEQVFLNNLFVKLSMTSTNSVLLYLTLVSCVLTIDLGDKLAISNRVAKDIISLQPDPDPRVYIVLRKILSNLSHVLGTSSQLIFQPLFRQVLKWINTPDNSIEVVVSCYRLLLLLYDLFFQLMEPYQASVQAIIGYSIKYNNKEIQQITYNILEIAFERQDASKPYSTTNLISRLMAQLNNSTKWSYFESAIGLANAVIHFQPECISSFKFTSMPLEFLNGKDTEAKIGALIAIPFIVKTTPDIFNIDSLKVYLKAVVPLIKKRSEMRGNAMVSMAKIIFQKSNMLLHFKKYVEKAIEYSKQLPPSPESTFFNIALHAGGFTTREDIIKDVFSQPLTNYMLDGLKMFLEIDSRPQTMEMVYINFQQIIDRSLNDPHSTPDRIISALKAMREIGTPMKNYAPSHMISFSRHLDSTDLTVRQTALDFVLDYQQERPSAEIVMRLLSYICTEIDDDLRNSVMPRLRMEPCIPAFIDILLTLLHDDSKTVKFGSLTFLTRLAYDPSVPDHISDFLTELLSSADEANKKTSMKCCLIVAVAAEKADILGRVIQNFAPTLIKSVLQMQTSSTAAISLLAIIIKFAPQAVDLESLVKHIDNAFEVHSTKRRYEAAVDLMISALQYTDLANTIYDRHEYLAIKLIQSSVRKQAESCKHKILEAITMIGPVTRNISTESSSGLSAIPFLMRCDDANPINIVAQATNGFVISLLLDVLASDLMSALHTTALESMLTVIKATRQIGFNLEGRVIDRLKAILKSNNMSTISVILNMTNMTTIIHVLGENFEPLMPICISLVKDSWNSLDKGQLIRMTEWMANLIPDLTTPYFGTIVSVFCQELNRPDTRMDGQILNAFVTFGRLIKLADNIVIPAIVEYMMKIVDNEKLIKETFLAFTQVLVNSNSKNYSVPIIRAMTEVVRRYPSAMDKAVDILVIIGYHMGLTFLLLEPQLEQTFALKKNTKMDGLLKSMRLLEEPPSDVLQFITPKRSGMRQTLSRSTSSGIFGGNVNKIRDTVPHGQTSAKDEGTWYAWVQDFSDAVIRNSMSRSIAACASLAEKHTFIKDSLFPMAFMLCYLTPENQDGSRRIIKEIFSNEYVPVSILRLFLTITEIFDVISIELPVKHQDIIAAALKADIPAIALRHAEILFMRGDNSYAETLISVNAKLCLPLAAQGVLDQARSLGIPLDRSSIAEKIGIWDEALKGYDEKLKTEQSDNLISNKLNCLYNLGEFTQMLQQSDSFPAMKCIAAFHMLDTEQFLQNAYMVCGDSSFDQTVRLISGVLQDIPVNSLKEKIFKNMSLSVFPAVAQDYMRVHRQISSASVIEVISEAAQYRMDRRLGDTACLAERSVIERDLERLYTHWRTRLQKMGKDPNAMHSIIAAMSLALPVSMIEKEIMECADLAIDKNKLDIAGICLLKLPDSPAVQYIRARYEYGMGKFEEAIRIASTLSANEECDNRIRSLAEIKLANWYTKMDQIEVALEHAEKAVEIHKDAESWYYCSLSNHHMFSKTNDIEFLRRSFTSLLNAMSNATSRSLQYSLKILETLFRFYSSEIAEEFKSMFSKINASAWVGVIPQILAQGGNANEGIRNIVIDLLSYIGLIHPQPVLYAIIVPLNSEPGYRRNVARAIYDRIAERHPKVAATTKKFSAELCRAAISRWEIWMSHLDIASGQTHSELILSEFDELYATTVDHKSETLLECSFINEFGAALENARQLINIFRKNNDEISKAAMWSALSNLYYQFKPAVESFNRFSLEDSAPFLCAGPIDISVPGTYSASKDVITIASIDKNVEVMSSKQKPRRIVMHGTDGIDYPFLLKGHEDTRLDERIMQLFQYLNSAINRSGHPMAPKLPVTTYKVTPLTREIGLIGWVPNCTTLYELIKSHRIRFNIHLDLETISAMKGSDYFDLPEEEKLSAFKRGLRATPGDDIRRSLFNGSTDTSNWLHRRTNYTASLASTSVFGYILGLGDRHPMNIMIDVTTAKLVHIDFGDSFEVAQVREIFPEKVPIRLTRMLVNALESSGVDGTFRSLCIHLLNTIRNSSQKVLGLLSAFAYDPLLQWARDERDGDGREGQNAALILNRIEEKLTGSDFGSENLSVEDQVDKLIQVSTDYANLCLMFKGWKPFW